MLPSPAEIANRDARRLALVFEELGGVGRPLADGWMAGDVPGSWAIYAAGVGVARGPTDAELDELVEWYDDRGMDARIQVHPYLHADLHRGLAKRGFVVDELVTLLGHPLTDLPPIDAPPGLSFRSIDRSSLADRAAWVAAQLDGFHDDGRPPAGIRPITERVARADRCRLWVLEFEGRVVGSGGLECFEGTSVLIAGAVSKAWRRRGFQSAFVRQRLQASQAAGDAYALVGSVAGGPTERNALRVGFRPVCTLIDLVRPRR